MAEPNLLSDLWDERADPNAARDRRWKIAGRLTIAVGTVIVIAAAGAGWVITRQADDAIVANNVAALVPDDPNIRAPAPPEAPDTSPDAAAPAAPAPVDIAAMPAENVLFLGLDTRPPGEEAISMGTSQSDVMMLVHLSAGRQRVDLISIPRDLWVPAPVCKAWDYSTNSLSDRDFPNSYAQWKITNAYAVGGPQCTVRAVQALTGLRIDRVIVINFDGFKAVIDTLGGVSMNFARPVVDAGRTIIAAPGPQIINGDQALALVRARHVAGDPTGDIGRIARQQQVLLAILSQVTSSGLLLDPVKLNDTLTMLVSHTSTDNVTLDDLLSLAQSMQSTDTTKVGFHILPTAPDPATDGLLQAAGNADIFTALVNDQPYPAASTG
jgi:LCP family protein required for cell wall assembly